MIDIDIDVCHIDLTGRCVAALDLRVHQAQLPLLEHNSSSSPPTEHQNDVIIIIIIINYCSTFKQYSTVEHSAVVYSSTFCSSLQ